MSFIQASKQKEPEDGVDDIIKSLGKATLVSVTDGNSESDTPPEADHVPGLASPPEPPSLPPSALPKCLRFDTAKARIDNIPRYLFRISDEETSGHTCAKWVKSEDVVDYERKKAEQENHGIFYKDHIKPYEEDFFKWDRRTAAKTLNDHIRWWFMTEGRINLHSWTSSLTFALAYAIYRKKKKGRPLEKISLTVVDTKRFPPGVFIRDMELIEEFRDVFLDDEEISYETFECRGTLVSGAWKDVGLPDMFNLRNRTCSRAADHTLRKASFYFGEYLSQGWLDLKGPGLTGASIILSCDEIINDNLFELDREWQNEDKKPCSQWAMPTLRLRKSFYENKLDKNKLLIPTTGTEVQAVINIAKNVTNQYGEAWGLVIAANLFALRARPDYEWAIKELYEKVSGLGTVVSCLQDLGETPDEKLQVPEVEEKLPEVRQFHKVARGIIRLRRSEALEKFCTQSKEIIDSARARAKLPSGDEGGQEERGDQFSAAISDCVELLHVMHSEFSDVMDPELRKSFIV